MVLDLDPILRGEKQSVEFEFAMPLSYMPDDLSDASASVSGVVEDHSGYMLLKADVVVKADAKCGRCTKDFPFSHRYRMESGVSRDEVEEENETEYLIAPDGKLDLGEAVQTFVILSLPYRFLCNSNCKGLCQKCGKNLNEGACGCKEEKGDPRWGVLKNYFD